jgi:4-amino-4-deoxy-L-arabinose transferase-like glycosyltransferase
VLLALYFLLQFALRVLVSGPSLELDEAEQVVLAQQLHWGYGSQPPLYTWLQTGAFALLGDQVVALALVKNLLLFGLYLLTFLAAREYAGEERPALVAAATLLLLPQIAWESQRDLTHSVLATAAAAATLYAGARLLRSGRTRHYLLFGACAGLGVLGKYNYAVFLLAFLLAALSLPQFRPRLLCRQALLALFVLLLLTSAHLLWMAGHVGDTLTQAGTFHSAARGTLLADYAQGLAALAKATAAFLGLLAVCHLLLCRKPAQTALPTDPFRTLLGRSLLLGLALCLVMVLGFRVTNFKDRWMQPLLFHAVIYLALRARPWLDRAAARRLLAAAGAVALLVLLALPGRTLLAGRLDDLNRFNAPWTALAGELRQAGFTGGSILAQDRWVGGNLLHQFPGSRARVPELPSIPAAAGPPWLIAWDATKRPALPAALQAQVQRSTGLDPSGLEPSYVSAPYRHAGHRRMRLGYLLLPAGSALPSVDRRLD